MSWWFRIFHWTKRSEAICQAICDYQHSDKLLTKCDSRKKGCRLHPAWQFELKFYYDANGSWKDLRMKHLICRIPERNLNFLPKVVDRFIGRKGPAMILCPVLGVVSWKAEINRRGKFLVLGITLCWPFRNLASNWLIDIIRVGFVKGWLCSISILWITSKFVLSLSEKTREVKFDSTRNPKVFQFVAFSDEKVVRRLLENQVS